MALGGGTFTSMNKVLGGTYINFISAASAKGNVSDRGVAAMGLELNWGSDDGIFEVSQEDFLKDTTKIFGYAYDSDEMKGLRDLFLHINTLYAYKLTTGGEKASNTFATARYCGTRGNDLNVVVASSVDVASAFDVSMYLGTKLVDKQTVKTAADLVDNDFAIWNKEAELASTAGTKLTGGTNGTVNGEAHQGFLNAIESYNDVNAIGYVGTDETTCKLYASFVKRMRDSVGMKMQVVMYNHEADYEGVVNVKNNVSDSGANAASLVYWVTGVIAGTAANASATNMTYDGEYLINCPDNQSQLEKALKAGKFTFHKVGTKINVLEDVNSLVTETPEKNELFKDNQTIRIIDAIASSIADVFNTKYLGKVPNNAAGRTSLWNDIVKIHQTLQDMQCLENFEPDDVTVAQGDEKKSVVVTDTITIVNTMVRLYMTVVIG